MTPPRQPGAPSRLVVPALPPGMIHVWKLGLDPGGSALAELDPLLSPDERTRAARYHFDRDRRRFVAARRQVRQILSAYTGAPAEALVFDAGAEGKPRLAGGPPFNVTHAHELALLAVADREVGVDVEWLGRAAPFEVAERFAPSERAAIAAAADRHRAFYACWVRKEAYLKAIGVGLTEPLDAFEVSVDPGAPARLLTVRGDAAAAAALWMTDVVTQPDYVAAVVARGAPGPVVILS